MCRQAKSPAAHVPHSAPLPMSSPDPDNSIVNLSSPDGPKLPRRFFSYQSAFFHSVLSTASKAMLKILLLKIHPFSRAFRVKFKSSLPTVPLWSGSHLLSSFIACSSTWIFSSSCSDTLWLFNTRAVSCHGLAIRGDLSLVCLLTISFLFLVNLALPRASQFHVTLALITTYPVHCVLTAYETQSQPFEGRDHFYVDFLPTPPHGAVYSRHKINVFSKKCMGSRKTAEWRITELGEIT